jgi:hypothetical protein
MRCPPHRIRNLRRWAVRLLPDELKARADKRMSSSGEASGSLRLLEGGLSTNMSRNLLAAFGVLLLLVTVGVVGCQTLFAASPAIDQTKQTVISDR